MLTLEDHIKRLKRSTAGTWTAGFWRNTDRARLDMILSRILENINDLRLARKYAEDLRYGTPLRSHLRATCNAFIRYCDRELKKAEAKNAGILDNRPGTGPGR